MDDCSAAIPDFYPVIPASPPVIPAKAGIHSVASAVNADSPLAFDSRERVMST